jgi:hypothetical protein
VEKDGLHNDHDERLDQKSSIVVNTKPVKHPTEIQCQTLPEGYIDIKAYFKMEAVNIIKGMSSDKPADVLVRRMEYIWSAYEVMGDRIKLFKVLLHKYFGHLEEYVQNRSNSVYHPHEDGHFDGLRVLAGRKLRLIMVLYSPGSKGVKEGDEG